MKQSNNRKKNILSHLKLFITPILNTRILEYSYDKMLVIKQNQILCTAAHDRKGKNQNVAEN